MADSRKSIMKVLPIEGYIFNKKTGYVNDPLDSGGETIGGVSFINWPKWAGWKIVNEAKKLPNFPKNLVGNIQLYKMLIEFYQVNFCDKIGVAKIKDQNIADMLVDSAVNEGIKPAVRRAQMICGISQTGEFSDVLKKKLNSF